MDKSEAHPSECEDDECDECQPSKAQRLMAYVATVLGQPPVIRSLSFVAMAALLLAWLQLVAEPNDLQRTSPLWFWFCVGVAAMAAVSFAAVFLTDPGRVPPEYRVPGATAADCEQARREASLHHRNRYACAVRFCDSCDGFKPPRAHHCSALKRCVLRMSHYCTFAATAIGLRNLKQYLQFLFYCLVGFAISIVGIVARLFFSELALSGSDWALVAFSVVLWLVALPNVLILFLQSGAGLLQNNTKIEVWERHWAVSDAAKQNRAYKYPYDHGNGFTNAIEIFGTNPILWWLPVVSTTVDGLHYAPLVPAAPAAARQTV